MRFEIVVRNIAQEAIHRREFFVYPLEAGYYPVVPDIGKLIGGEHKIEEQNIVSGKKLKVTMAPGGGWSAIISRIN